MVMAITAQPDDDFPDEEILADEMPALEEDAPLPSTPSFPLISGLILFVMLAGFVASFQSLCNALLGPVVVPAGDAVDYARLHTFRNFVTITGAPMKELEWGEFQVTRYNYTPWVQDREQIARYTRLKLPGGMLLCKVDTSAPTNGEAGVTGALFGLPSSSLPIINDWAARKEHRARFHTFMLDGTVYRPAQAWSTLGWWLLLLFLPVRFFVRGLICWWRFRRASRRPACVS